MKYINPQCVSFSYNENGKKIYKSPYGWCKGIAYCADGFLLPCCWCDQTNLYEDFKNLGFYDESLKLENNDSIEDILLSETWKNFIHVILSTPHLAPRVCKKKCGIYEG